MDALRLLNILMHLDVQILNGYWKKKWWLDLPNNKENRVLRTIKDGLRWDEYERDGIGEEGNGWEAHEGRVGTW